MKTIKFLLAALLLSAAGVALADPPAIVGRLSYLAGTVSFAPADAPGDWGMAPLNRPITTGDRLWADRDGRAELRVGSTAIRVGALTSVDVLRLDDDGIQLRLAQGTLNVQLRQLDPGDSFEISTPAGAVLLTQAGNYRVNVEPSGATTAVLVRRGQADVLTGNVPLVLRDNQYAGFSAQGQEPLAAPAPDEFDNWAAARDRQEERVVATRYVPPAMTGYEDLDQHGAWHAAPEYGNVWIPAAVPVGWAPYRYGRWVWVSPWGWTWVDNAPWGFAPYHYGRWVWWGNRWAWAPGPRVARPVYAPALVAFVGGANWSVSVRSGPAVAWVPLGWREPYIPWYRHSPTYVRNVNITHVTNVNVIHQYTNVNNVTHIRYVNRDVPSATTVVARETFVRARYVHEAPLSVPAQALAAARVTHDSPVAQPERHSRVVVQANVRTPAAVEAREVVALRAPSVPARLQANGVAPTERGAALEQRPRVRVLSAEQASAARRTLDTSPAAAPAPAERRERATESPPPAAVQTRPRPEQAAPPVAAPTERRGRAAEQAQPNAQAKPRPEQPAASPPAAVHGERRERSAQPAPPPVQPKRLEQTAPPAPPAQPQPPDQQARAMQQEQQRRAREQAQQQEQQRRAREQAQQLQQQKLQAQKDQHQQEQQQRAREVQQQRERQYQQAQQAEQQRQLQRQQQREQRQPERAQQPPPRPASAQPAQTPPPQQQARRGAEPERQQQLQQR